MEILKRKIEAKREEIKSTNDKKVIMSCSITDNARLSCRWHNEGETDKDILINFTEAETERIRKTMRRDC